MEADQKDTVWEQQEKLVGGLEEEEAQTPGTGLMSARWPQNQ